MPREPLDRADISARDTDIRLDTEIGSLNASVAELAIGGRGAVKVGRRTEDCAIGPLS